MSGTKRNARDRRDQALKVERAKRDMPNCNKVAFPSKAVALGRLRALAAEGMTKAYRCRTCDHWHLTSQDVDRPGGIRLDGTGERK